MAIKVTTQGGETKTVDFKQGMLVGDALKAAGINSTDKATITVNNKSADIKSTIKDNDIIVIIPKIKNG